MRTPSNRHHVVVFWTILLVVWGLDTHGNWAGTGDEPHYAMIARSLVFDRDLDLGRDYASPDNLVNRGGLEPGAHVRAGKDGIVRPVHDIGLPLAATPFFAAAWGTTRLLVDLVPRPLLMRGKLDAPLIFRHLLSLWMIILSALVGVRLYRLVVEAGGRPRLGLAWTLLFMLSPPLLSYSFLFFTEMPAAAIVAWTWGALTDKREDRRRTSITVLLGASIGFLPLLHVRYAGRALGRGALFLWDARRRRDVRSVILFLAPAAALVALRLWLNMRFWGTIATSPHVRVGESAGALQNVVAAAAALLGLCFDQAHGLLGYAPIYLAVLPGAIVLWHTRRSDLARIVFVAACYLVPIAIPVLNAHGWIGGWSPAARFLVPILPLLVVAGYPFVAQLSDSPRGLAVVVALQLALDCLCWSHPKLLWNDVGRPSTLLAYLSPRAFDLSRWFPSWEQPAAYTIVVSLVGLVCWFAVSVVVARRVIAVRSQPAASAQGA